MFDYNKKSRKAYNKKADGYDDSFEGRFTLKFRELLLSEITLDVNANVLDVACGNGSLLAALNKKTPINGFGIDIAENMIKNASVKTPDMVFRTSGCESIPFEDSSMDLITVSAAYHHFPDTTAFAKEANRVLKTKGKIYIAEIYLPLFLRMILNPFVPLMPDGDVRFYSPKKIIRNFERFGFQKIDIKIHGSIQIVALQKL